MASKTFLAIFIVLFSGVVFAAAPGVSSETHPPGVWSNSIPIRLHVTYSGADGYSYILDTSPDTIPDNNVDTSDPDISLGSKLDGIYWFHVKAKSSSPWSDAAHYEIKVDKLGPSRPENLTAASTQDGSVLLTWGASTDEASGVSHYDIYRSTLRFITDPNQGNTLREFTISDASDKNSSVVKRIAQGIEGASYTDNSFILGAGLRFHYKIQPVDNAGNTGAASSAVSIKTFSACNFALSMETVRTDTNLSILISSDGDFKRGHLVVKDPAGVETVVIESASNVSALDVGYSLAGKQNGTYLVSFTAFDEDSDECKAEENYTYDTTNPEIELLSPSATLELTGQVSFEMKASDSGTNPSGIESVLVLVEKGGEELEVAQAQLEGDKYIADWNTLNFENGRFRIIARATDFAGNKGEKSALYNIENTFFERANATEAFAQAQGKRLDALEFIADVKKQNIDISSLEGLVTSADQNLVAAKSLLDSNKNFDDAQRQAQGALNVYSSVRNKLKVSSYSSADYAYNENQLDVFLQGAGLQENLRPRAKELISSNGVSRRLEVLKVEDSNYGTYYAANIIISFTNAGSEGSSLKIVEVIPKKFINSSSIISAGQKSFEILNDDPVISFVEEDLNSGETREFVYGINQKLTRQQADAIVAADVLNYYVSPPILLDSDSKVTSFSSSGFDIGSVFSGLGGIDFGGDNTLLLGGAALVVLVLLMLIFVVGALAIYFLFIKKKKA